MLVKKFFSFQISPSVDRNETRNLGRHNGITKAVRIILYETIKIFIREVFIATSFNS